MTDIVATDPEYIAVLQTLPRPGRIEVTTLAGEHWQSVGTPEWGDGWPDTDEALQQIRATGYEPAGRGQIGWRFDARGWAIEVRRR